MNPARDAKIFDKKKKIRLTEHSLRFHLSFRTAIHETAEWEKCAIHNTDDAHADAVWMVCIFCVFLYVQAFD